MCQSNYKAKMLVAKDMDVVAVVGSKDTKVTLDRAYGNILGISIGESYARATMGQINLSLKSSSKERIVNTPLTQFFPDGERQMWPLDISAGTDVTITLDINVAGLDPNVPIPLIFHTDGGETCSN